mmetsp:Transcript_37871/g.72838  ORF Transcript_37871/g.72838 Transcript_37871/m.72838 type:complete len:110 (-) Transcript_37871:159-488(-)
MITRFPETRGPPRKLHTSSFAATRQDFGSTVPRGNNRVSGMLSYRLRWVKPFLVEHVAPLIAEVFQHLEAVTHIKYERLFTLILSKLGPIRERNVDTVPVIRVTGCRKI